MSDTVIKVENLSKSYLVGHNAGQRERYIALRDVIARNAKSLARKTRDMLTGRPIVQGDEVEEFWALKDVAFEIKQGDRVGIIGRNGAGKTTLLKVLSRITQPTTGRVTISGRVASLLEVGTGFHPELTGRENIFLNGAILGMSRKEIQGKFDEIVDFAEVDRFLDTPVKRYSSGMYVRLAFAVAAHLEPEILVVDEVLAVGDAQFQKKCLAKMEDVGKEGRTVLFVSHNMAAVRALCRNTMLFDSGSIMFNGNTSNAISRYTSSSGKRLLRNEDSKLRNSWVDVYQVSLVDNSLELAENIYTNTEFSILIRFAIKIKSRVGLTIMLYDSANNCIFSSINNRISDFLRDLDVGHYGALCTIPANVLNNNLYSVSLVLFSNNFRDGVIAHNIIYFDVQDSNELRGDYFGDISGALRPDLQWRLIPR